MENAPFKLETCHMQFHGISLQIKDDYTTTRQGLAPSAIMPIEQLRNYTDCAS
jgi:hypothetical protein